MTEGTLHAAFRGLVNRPVAVFMLFVAAVVFGWVSYRQLPVDLMPDVTHPTVTVRTEYAGAAPEEVEQQISRPVEESLATLDGLVSVESRSRAGRSDVVLAFGWGTDLAATVQNIRENLQTVFLPDEADRPLILRFDPSLEPFLRLALGRAADAPEVPPDESLFLLREVADGPLRREIEGLEGIAAVGVRGGLEREVRIEVREDWLVARRLTLEQVRQSLAAENVNIAGGSILEGDVEYLVRTLNEFQDVDEIRQVRIRRADGVRVPLEDVAQVRETHHEREVVSRLDGDEAVEIELFREADANVVDVAHQVKAHLFPEDDDGPLDDDLQVVVLDDQAAFVEAAIGNLTRTAVLGGLLAVFVLFLFLRDIRATAIIGIAIPVSLLVAFGPLYLGGVSLNLMSLGGLALGVGMLVDNAVVVLENIQRYRDEGCDRREASVKGGAGVAGAVTASTLTTVAVFLPVSFVEGMAGELFGDLAVAVVCSLLASLGVALVLVPMLSALELSPPSQATALPGLLGMWARRRAWRQARATLGIPAPPEEARLGRRALRQRIWEESWGAPWALARRDGAWMLRRLWRLVLLPWLVTRLAAQVASRMVTVPTKLVLGIAVGTLLWLSNLVVRPLAALAWAAARAFGAVFDRVANRYGKLLDAALGRRATILGLGALSLLLALGGARLLGTELLPEVRQGRFFVEVALEVGTPLAHTAERLQEVEARVLAHPDVAHVHSVVGVDRQGDARPDEGEHTARLGVFLEPQAMRAEPRVMEELRGSLEELPRMSVAMAQPALFAFRTPIEVVVHGFDLDELREAGDRVAQAMEQIPGVRDVQSSLVAGHPEVQVRYDRQRLHHLGLDTAGVAAAVRDKVQGATATALRRQEHRIDLRVQLAEADRGTLDDLARLNVNPDLDPPIPLDAVAELVEGVGPSEVRRVDQQRAVVVTAGLSAFDLGTAGERIEASLIGLDLPSDLGVAVVGQSREMEQSLGSLQFALLLAIFLVYVIMASTFESLLQPMVILFSVPLALVGVVGGLSLVGLPVSVVVLLGTIVLAGVVVNNAIVLVDTINRLRAEGMDRMAAIARGGRLRLRPILITSTTTILGLFPLSLGLGAGAEIQQPLALTVIGGLITGTLLTLVVIPVGYAVVSRTGRP